MPDITALLAARKKPAFGATESLVLVLFSVMLGWSAYHHGTYYDEAQGWLIARDNSWWHIMTHQLGYEGAPGLWISIARLCVLAHIPFMGLRWVAAGFSLAGVALWLRYARLPLWAAAMLPFSYWVAMTFSMLERPYCLYMLLVGAQCAVFCSKRPRPILFSVIAGLLANLVMHSALFAIGMAMAYTYEQWKRRTTSSALPVPMKRYAVALAIFCGLCAVSIATAFPPADCSFPAGGVNRPAVRRLLHRPPFVERQTAWAAYATPFPSFPASRLMALVNKAANIIGFLTYPFSYSNLLAVVLLAAQLSRLWRQKQIHLTLPYALMVIGGLNIYAGNGHAALYLIAFLAITWLSWPEKIRGHWTYRSELVLCAALFLCLAEQIVWNGKALAADLHGADNYSADRAAAEYLQKNYAGKRVAGLDFLSVGLVPYFQQTPYFNYTTSYWPWSLFADPNFEVDRTMASHPDAVVGNAVLMATEGVENQVIHHPMAPYWSDGGFSKYEAHWNYVETHRFCRTFRMRASSDRAYCQVVYEPMR